LEEEKGFRPERRGTEDRELKGGNKFRKTCRRAYRRRGGEEAVVRGYLTGKDAIKSYGKEGGRYKQGRDPT